LCIYDSQEDLQENLNSLSSHKFLGAVRTLVIIEDDITLSPADLELCANSAWSIWLVYSGLSSIPSCLRLSHLLELVPSGSGEVVFETYFPKRSHQEFVKIWESLPKYGPVRLSDLDYQFACLSPTVAKYSSLKIQEMKGTEAWCPVLVPEVYELPQVQHYLAHGPDPEELSCKLKQLCDTLIPIIASLEKRVDESS